MSSKNKRYEPSSAAEAIIDIFGGIRPMAGKMNIAVTTVQGWKKRGKIPQNRRDEILTSAKGEGFELPESLLESALAGETYQEATKRPRMKSYQRDNSQNKGFDTPNEESANNIFEDETIEENYTEEDKKDYIDITPTSVEINNSETTDDAEIAKTDDTKPQKQPASTTGISFKHPHPDDDPFDDDEEWPEPEAGIVAAVMVSLAAIFIAMSSPWWGPSMREKVGHPTAATYAVEAATQMRDNIRIDTNDLSRRIGENASRISQNETSLRTDLTSRINQANSEQNRLTTDFSSLERRMANLELSQDPTSLIPPANLQEIAENAQNAEDINIDPIYDMMPYSNIQTPPLTEQMAENELEWQDYFEQQRSLYQQNQMMQQETRYTNSRLNRLEISLGEIDNTLNSLQNQLQNIEDSYLQAMPSSLSPYPDTNARNEEIADIKQNIESLNNLNDDIFAEINIMREDTNNRITIIETSQSELQEGQQNLATNISEHSNSLEETRNQIAAELTRIEAESQIVAEEHADMQNIETAYNIAQTALNDTNSTSNFTEDFAELQRLLGETTLATELENLAPIAQTGAKTTSLLKAEFAPIARAALADTRTEDLDGWQREAATQMQNIFSVRTAPNTEAEGTDAEAIIARTEGWLRQNDITNAIAELSNLTEPAASHFDEWLIEAEKRAKIDSFLQSLNEEYRLSSRPATYSVRGSE